MSTPKLKRDWIGLRVRTLRTLENDYMIIAKGTVLTVANNHGGLHLLTDKCPHCHARMFIRRVGESSVEIVEEESS